MNTYQHMCVYRPFAGTRSQGPMMPRPAGRLPPLWAPLHAGGQRPLGRVPDHPFCCIVSSACMAFVIMQNNTHFSFCSCTCVVECKTNYEALHTNFEGLSSNPSAALHSNLEGVPSNPSDKPNDKTRPQKTIQSPDRLV